MPELTNGTIAEDPKQEITQEEVLSNLLNLSSSEEFKDDSIQRAVAIIGRLNARPTFEWTTTKLKEAQSALQEALDKLGGNKKNKKTADKTADIITITQAIQGKVGTIAMELESRKVYQITASGEQIRDSDSLWYDNPSYVPKEAQIPIKLIDGAVYVFSSESPPETQTGQISVVCKAGTYIMDEKTQKGVLYVDLSKKPHLMDICRNGYVQIGDYVLIDKGAVHSNQLEAGALIDKLHVLTDNLDIKQFLSHCISQDDFLEAANNVLIANFPQYAMGIKQDFPVTLIIKKNDDGSISIKYVFAYDEIKHISSDTGMDLISISSEDGKPLMTIDTTYIIRPKEGGGVVLEVEQCTHNIHDKRLLEKQLIGTNYNGGAESTFINPFYKLISKSRKKKTVLEQWVQPATEMLDLRLEALEKGKTISALLKERGRNIKEAIASLITQLVDVSVNKKLEDLVDIVTKIDELSISLESLLKDGRDLLRCVCGSLESCGEKKQKFEELKSEVETSVEAFEAEKLYLRQLQELKDKYVILSINQLPEQQVLLSKKAEEMHKAITDLTAQLNVAGSNLYVIAEQIGELSTDFAEFVKKEEKLLKDISKTLEGRDKQEKFVGLRGQVELYVETFGTETGILDHKLQGLKDQYFILFINKLLEEQRKLITELDTAQFIRNNPQFLNISAEYKKLVESKQQVIERLAKTLVELKNKTGNPLSPPPNIGLQDLIHKAEVQQNVLKFYKDIKIPGSIGHFFSWLFRSLTRLFRSKGKVEDAQQAKVVEGQVGADYQQLPQPSLLPKPESKEPSKGSPNSGLDKAKQQVRSGMNAMVLVATASSAAAFAVNPSSLGVAAVVAAGVAAAGAVAATMKTNGSEKAAAGSTKVIMENVNGSDSEITKLVEKPKMPAEEAKSVSVEEQKGVAKRSRDEDPEPKFHLYDFPHS